MKHSKGVKLLVLLTFLFACASNILFAQQSQQQAVLLKNGSLVPFISLQNWLNGNPLQSQKDPAMVIVNFSSMLTNTNKAYLKSNGLDVVDYLQSSSYIAVLHNNANVTTLKTSGILGIATVNAGWKSDSYLWDIAAAAKQEPVNIVVTFIDNINDDEVRNKVQSLSALIMQEKVSANNFYKISIQGDKINELANWYAVKYISPLSGNELLNFQAKSASKSNIGNLSPLFGGYGLTGKGVSLGIGDNVSGVFHVDLYDRIINYNPESYTNHGMHINGIAGGAGIIDPKGEGVAMGVTLIDHAYTNVWEQLSEMYNAHNMTVTNNSYASVVGNCGFAGTYDIYSQNLDQLALDYPDVLQVFAAGNDGYLDCPSYPKGYATVNGGFQPAKNIIVVTSTNKNYVNAIDGSRGPIKDGRLKPEITAVGVDVNSTTKSEQYLVSGGTSMASPGVAGALALLTERYKQINGSANPRADVLKTLLLNGTTDIGNPGPDYRFGFGFMNLYRSLQMLDNSRYYTGNLSNGNSDVKTINVPANTAQLKVMLCWNDLPANPLAANQLVNDLDVVVTTPSSETHLPFILDPAPANILNNAVEGIDNKNNCEQVTINNPSAGDYTVTIKGTNIVGDAQRFVVSYDFIPVGVQLTYPTTGAQVKVGDSLRIYWDASDNGNNFTLEYSESGGAGWSLIDNSIPASQKYYTWFVPYGINSGTSQMRLTRNNTGQVYTTGNFTMNIQPQVKLDTVQCPGYMRINWDPIPNATEYEILRKIGPAMQIIDSTTDIQYTLSGLSLDSTYYVSVRPIINGLQGYRSIAIKRQPKDGTCKGNISDGDFMIDAIANPVIGRKFTSTELKSDETLSVVVRNLDNVPTNYYRFSYSINGAPWQSETSNYPIEALGKHTIQIPGFDISGIGSYDIKVAITNLLMQDKVTGNDTLHRVIKHLPNEPVNLASTYSDDFESLSVVNVSKNSIGISPNGHWDFFNDSDSGRLRTYINDSLLLNGTRSLSMDAVKPVHHNINELIGTFNLSAYNIQSDEVRLEFLYRVHGRPDTLKGNEVYVRGNDTQPWQSIYTYNVKNAAIGKVQTTGSLSVSDGLNNNAQNFSSSFQVKIGQNDTTIIGGKSYGCGLTIDDFKLYTVQNDVQLTAVITPRQTECGMQPGAPFVVSVFNSVNQSQSDINVSYRLDGGSIVTETISELKGKQRLQYTFKTTPDLSAPGKHLLDVWVSATGDSYSKNDSILNYIAYNQPLVTNFPYKEDFEATDGGWFADGINNSWQYGTPVSPKINRANSGSKAWKTSLTDYYNATETSYLYAPCFDISKLSNPTLRFKTALNVENCGIVLCDATYMEYSTDGVNWQRLGKANRGINWYSDTLYQIWGKEINADWHEAITPLPKLNGVIYMRFAMYSDQEGEAEGMAIDDVEVYDNFMYPDKELVNIYPNPTVDGKINIDWTADESSVMKVVMTDMLGKEVYRAEVKATGNYNKTQLQTTDFYSGLYFIRLHIDDRKYTYKITYQ